MMPRFSEAGVSFAKTWRVLSVWPARRGIIPVLTTLPPHVHQPKRSGEFNAEIQRAQAGGFPLVDFHGEIFRRRPADWNGTLNRETG